MKSRAKQWIGSLLAVCLVMAMLPTAALAADTGKAIQLVSEGSAGNLGGGQADNIYFGTYEQSSDGSGGYNLDPIKWRVLSNASGQLFLLSDQNLDVFQYHTEEETVTWETSTMRSWLNGYDTTQNSGGSSGIDYTNDNFLDDAFSNKEQTAIAETTVINNDNPNYDTEGGNNTTDRIFLLSIAEADNRSYFPKGSNSRFSANTVYVADGGKLGSYMYEGGETDRWWLRSPGFNNSMAAFIEDDGGDVYEGNPVNNKTAAVRPAFNLNLSDVLFTSAAAGGKSASGLTAVQNYSGNDWKLTLKDSTRSSFAISNAKWSGNTLTFSYSGAQTGTNEYLSAVILENGAITCYGRILRPTSASGTANLSLPSGVTLSDTTTLYVFNEQFNGDKRTDYASALSPIPAPAAEQPPVITTTTLQGGKAGAAYSQTLAATGTAPITWSIESGSLPAGLTLSGNTISGTPTTAGTFTFKVKAANGAGSDMKELSIVIQAAPVEPGPPPVITSPTTDQKITVAVDDTATLRVTAKDAQSYQWYVDRGNGSGFTKISGATGASYTTSAVTLENDGYRYYCAAMNAYGEMHSPIFTLNVQESVEVPPTGDSSQMGLWFGLALLSFAGLAACATLWRRKRAS